MISELASIHPNAKIGKNVSVGPGTVIGDGVVIGDDTWIGPHVVIQGPCTIGKRNKIFQFSSVGDEPQDITYKGEPTRLEIGDDNVIREYSMISRGTVKGGGVTRIGTHNYFMAYIHVGHDCIIGNHVIMINYAALSGHVTVDDYAIIGGYAAVHQFCRVGAYAFIARATYVPKDVLPYVMVIGGHEPSVCGINTVGLKRRNFSTEVIEQLKRAYRVIFRKGLTVQEALTSLQEMLNDCIEIRPIIEILEASTRGVVR